MAAAQSERETLDLLQRLIGESIVELQVTGVNSLKTVAPEPSDLIGARIQEVSLGHRILRISTGANIITIDLQRTGYLSWHEPDGPALRGLVPRATVTLVVGPDKSLHFVEPAKTKRISVWITQIPT